MIDTHECPIIRETVTIVDGKCTTPCSIEDCVFVDLDYNAGDGDEDIDEMNGSEAEN